jgi:signal transduction histidine kinase
LFQGLYLILLPLLFNCLLILILNNAVIKAERQIDISRKQMTVVYKLTHAIYAVTEILLGGSNAMMNGSYRFFSPLINRGWTIVQDDLSAVAQNVDLDESYKQFDEQMKSLLDRQQAIFLKSEDRSLGFNNVFIKMRRAAEWIRIGGKQSLLLHEQQKVVRENFLHSLQLQRNEQKLIEEIVVAGFIANIILALLLYRHFHRNFMGRVNALSKMARKLPLNEPIDEVLTGSDELQDIGVELAKMSWTLADVAEYRRSLMQMMAHDVRSPLMAADISIATMSKFLGSSLSAGGRQSLIAAGDALADCLVLVNDLLLLESLENGEAKYHLKDCDLHHLISSVVENADYLHSHALENLADAFVVKADAELISKVLDRLLREASLRAPAGSTIKVTTALQTDGRVVLEVSDQGKPLTEAESTMLFDKLQQAQRTAAGEVNSLGLSIAPAIMALHNGSIQQRSSDDGNAFTLHFLRAES